MENNDCKYCWCDTCADIGLCTNQRENVTAAVTSSTGGDIKTHALHWMYKGQNI